jgi:5'-deoxynucleotidase YfbR-like HD superfamily hydrolase
MFTINTPEMQVDAFAEKIQQDYAKFMEYVEQDSRSEQLKAFYKIFEDQLLSAPASAKVHFHNAYPGGYLDHILRVTELALKMASLYKTSNGFIDFTKQELIFAALNHDLGKLGTEDEPYYLNQDSDWHRKRGEMYKHNDNLQYFKAPDRGLMMLQKYGISVTETEWLSIKLSDGIYSTGNDSYLKNDGMRVNLPYIIHWADHMATRIEKDKNRFVL